LVLLSFSYVLLTQLLSPSAPLFRLFPLLSLLVPLSTPLLPLLVRVQSAAAAVGRQYGGINLLVNCSGIFHVPNLLQPGGAVHPGRSPLWPHTQPRATWRRHLSPSDGAGVLLACPSLGSQAVPHFCPDCVLAVRGAHSWVHGLGSCLMFPACCALLLYRLGSCAESTMRWLDPEAVLTVFKVNALGPMMVTKVQHSSVVPSCTAESWCTLVYQQSSVSLSNGHPHLLTLLSAAPAQLPSVGCTPFPMLRA